MTLYKFICSVVFAVGATAALCLAAITIAAFFTGEDDPILIPALLLWGFVATVSGPYIGAAVILYTLRDD